MCGGRIIWGGGRGTDAYSIATDRWHIQQTINICKELIPKHGFLTPLVHVLQNNKLTKVNLSAIEKVKTYKSLFYFITAKMNMHNYIIFQHLIKININ